MASVGVRQERTRWRDERISLRHREWGMGCPAVDLDFLLVEYNACEPVALVEYKHERARIPNLKHPTYKALSVLASNYSIRPLPFLVVFYYPDIWAFRITPVNDAAQEWFIDGEVLCEQDFVKRLYRMRNRVVSQTILAPLRKEVPLFS